MNKLNLRYENLPFKERVEDNRIAAACGLVFNKQQKFDHKIALNRGWV